MNRSG